MRLLVLAGGFGTRLQATVIGLPKALAPVGNVPFLKLQIELWRSQGINSFVFLLHHQADLIIEFLDKEKKIGALINSEVDCLVESIPMDTGGAVAHAVEKLHLKGNFLVTNADTWLGTGIMEMAQATVPAMAIVKLSNTNRYGRIKLDAQQRVIGFQEKSNKHVVGWINAGFYKLNAELFQVWDHLPFSLEQQTFPLMAARGKLNAITLKADFIDIGVPDDYEHFCRWIASGRKGALCF
jgi:D-glycero-alpha-D-manno-heptose 1-phosphate guanylyltransferase